MGFGVAGAVFGVNLGLSGDGVGSKIAEQQLSSLEECQAGGRPIDVSAAGELSCNHVTLRLVADEQDSPKPVQIDWAATEKAVVDAGNRRDSTVRRVVDATLGGVIIGFAGLVGGKLLAEYTIGTAEVIKHERFLKRFNNANKD